MKTPVRGSSRAGLKACPIAAFAALLRWSVRRSARAGLKTCPTAVLPALLRWSRASALLSALTIAACSSPPAARAPSLSARNLVLITIDTLRADHVGAYGYAAARTPSLDRLAREGARFDSAFTPAPITLTAHASLLTGLYPPGHGARHNGMAVRPGVRTLPAVLRASGFAAGAFVAAFPLDRRFGLDEGFDVYGDRMPRGPDGHLASERPGREVVDEAIAWVNARQGRFLLWVHLFEPHAPYGDPSQAPAPGARPLTALERYDEEIATADAQVGRLLAALGPRLAESLVVVAGDHGEAFGEHGEFTHSLFVYDTTLRVPLIVRGPGIAAGRVVADRVCLVDVAPTVLRLLGAGSIDADGIDLSPALAGGRLPARALYAESFAPLLDFGWSPLRSIREGPWKAIAAPRPELFDVETDRGEERDAAETNAGELQRLLPHIDRYGGADLPSGQALQADAEARTRLNALGYLHGGPAGGAGLSAAARARPDPKDRRQEAARIARVISGESQGAELLASLQALAKEDPANGQVRLRLGHALVEAGRLAAAEPHFTAAIAAHLPSADPYLGLALCQAQRGAVAAALDTLHRGDRIEPGNPVLQANVGLLEARAGRGALAAAALERALAIDPDLHEARFNLARVYARDGRRAEALSQAAELLRRLPPGAPQRPEVERLLDALR